MHRRSPLGGAPMLSAAPLGGEVHPSLPAAIGHAHTDGAHAQFTYRPTVESMEWCVHIIPYKTGVCS